jgi:hypothetical protein
MRPCLENTHHKNRAGGVAQVVGPEFKPQYCKKKKKIPKGIKYCIKFLLSFNIASNLLFFLTLFSEPYLLLQNI